MRRASLLLIVLLLGACATVPDQTGGELRQTMGIDVTPQDAGDAPEVSYSAEVLMSRAEGYFQSKEFDQAAQEYARFLELHATHPWASYALYREGECYVRQVKTPDREPALPKKARQAFENLIANYPDSPAVPHAREQRDWSVEQLALHDLGIARFYLRTHRAPAALERLNKLSEEFAETDAALDARLELGQALEDTGDLDGAMAAYESFLALPDRDPKRRAAAQKARARLSAP